MHGSDKFNGYVGSVTSWTIIGSHSQTYYARVKARNGAGLYGTYSISSDGITIDQAPPVTSDNAPSAWQISTVTVTLTPIDALSGVGATYYSINGGTWTEGATATIFSHGIHILSYYSVDNAGNIEATKTKTIQIDTTPPVINLTSPTDGSSTSNIYPFFFWQGTDTESGISKYDLYINGTLTKTFNGSGITSFIVTDWEVFGTETPFGTHTWCVVAHNSAGISTQSTTNTLVIFRQINDIDIHITQIEPSGFPEIDVYCEVVDQYPFYLEMLQPSNFTAKEDGISETPISVVPISGTSNLISVVLDIDRSGSMGGNKIVDAKIAACSFVDNMQEEDKAEIISFASNVTVNQSFTNDKTLLKNAINSLVANGWTALYDSIWESVNDLYHLSGQKATIVLTDGKDEGGVSKYTKEQVIAYAKQCGIPVYTIGLGSGVNEAVLKEIAGETCGEYYYSPGSDELKKIYLRISKKLREQYRITYTTHNKSWDGSTRTVSIEVVYGTLTGSDFSIYKSPKSPGPSSTITDLPAYLNQSSYTVSWTGTGTPGYGGLDSFDIQYKDGADGQWRDWLIRTIGTSSLFGLTDRTEGREGHTYYFQSRAWDTNGLWEAYPGTDGDTCVTIDFTPPTSNVSALPQYVASSFAVSWTGTDTLAGVKCYDIQYSKAGTNTWTDWLTQVTSNSAIFGPATESVTYYFRSRSQDNAGNWEEYSDQADAATTPDTTPPTGTPTQPTDYGTYSSSASITFAWTQGNATDTETGIAGYWLQV
ncbi:MAG: VWA domain-containing protein, partial [Gammaproteobacteria bacterium]|nr:VWA domain-containing protein [Gammaproteobacteria bacterium]